MVECSADESLILLLNDLFLGLVRQDRANVADAFFKQDNLALLLRQAVVSAYTAMDVFFPALLEAHLPTVVRIRQRNTVPKEGDVGDLFRDFRLKMEDLPPILEEDEATSRWDILARRMLDHCSQRTLSNPQGINAVMLLLGVETPWKQIAARAGLDEKGLRAQIQSLSKRRNDIVHRGDRLLGQTDAAPQPIDYAWTRSHVNAVESVVAACDRLAMQAIERLQDEAGLG